MPDLLDLRQQKDSGSYYGSTLHRVARRQSQDIEERSLEKSLMFFDSETDEEMLGNLYERQLKQSALMKNAFSLYYDDLALKERNASYQKSLFLRSSRDRAAASNSST